MTEYIVEVNENPTITFDGWNVRCEDDLVQREEVVRCMDCKWFTPEYEYLEKREYGVFETFVEPPDCGNPERCSHHYDSVSRKMVPVHVVTQPNGFCAWGERR